MNRIPKKISFSVFILAIIVSASFFYFSKAKESIYSGDSGAEKSMFVNKPEKEGENKPEPLRDVKIIFLGDMMFDRYIRQVAEKKGNDFIFEKIKNELEQADLVVGNLEGPITSRDSVSIGTKEGEARNYVFTFDPGWVRTLYENNIRLVNLGNNHILNQKISGLEETKKNLDGAKVEYFGDIAVKNSAGMYVDMYVDNYAIKNIKNNRIGFVNYNQFSPGSRERTLKNIAEIKEKADALVVFTHWGVEYADGPKENIKNLAHEFIDQGADLIIGTHPHVIQNKEEYKGKMIYYSLGNFIFDQYFDPRTQEGMIVSVTIDPKDSSFKFENKTVSMKRNGETTLNK